MKELCTIYNNCKAVGDGRYLARALSANQIILFGNAIRNSRFFLKQNPQSYHVDGVSLKHFLDVINYEIKDSLVFHQVTWKTNSNHLVSIIRNDKLGGYDIAIGADKSDYFYNKIKEVLNNCGISYFPQGLLKEHVLVTVGDSISLHQINHGHSTFMTFKNKKTSIVRISEIIDKGILSYFKFLNEKMRDYYYVILHMSIGNFQKPSLDEFLICVIDEINTFVTKYLFDNKEYVCIDDFEELLSKFGYALKDTEISEYLINIIVLELYLRGYDKLENNHFEFKKNNDIFDYSLFNKRVMDILNNC